MIGSDSYKDVIDKWICNSVSTHNITNDSNMMYNVKKSGYSVRIGDLEMIKFSWVVDIDFNDNIERCQLHSGFLVQSIITHIVIEEWDVSRK